MKRVAALLLLLSAAPLMAQPVADPTYGFGPPPQEAPQAAPQPAPPPPPEPGHTLRGPAIANDAAPPCRNAATTRQLRKLDGELAQVAALLVNARKALADLQTGASLRASAVSRSKAQRDQIATLEARIANATRAQVLVQKQATTIRGLKPC